MPTSSVDYLVLTAANRSQARGYETQLDHRAARGALPAGCRHRVVADPGDRRVGSGGSTLFVLAGIARELHKHNPHAKSLAELFTGKRILIIHSGGDSRRLCAYAAQGKSFAPLPCDTSGGEPATLFDLILAGLIDLPCPPCGQVLIAAGDVLLTFNPSDVDFNKPGLVGVAYPAPIERARQHGVYVADKSGRVADFLQKPDLKLALERKAIDSVGRLLIDTGLLSLDPDTTAHWLDTSGVQLRGGKITRHPRGLVGDIETGRSKSIDLYEQILMAIPGKIGQERYLKQVGPAGNTAADRRRRDRLKALFGALHGQSFHVNVLPYCEFFHIGTTREMLFNVGTLSRTARQFNFENLHRSVVSDRASVEGAFIYNSFMSGNKVRIGEGAMLEAVHTRQTVELPGSNLVTGWPDEVTVPLRLPEGVGVVCLPMPGGKWTAVTFGATDDFKSSRQTTGTYAGRPLTELLERLDADATEVWDNDVPVEKQSLWDARLWIVGDATTATRWAIALLAGRGRSASFRRARRLSMSQIITRVDHRRIIAQRGEIQRQAALHQLGRRLADDKLAASADVVALLRSAGEAKVALEQVDRVIERSNDSLDHARLHWLAARVVEAYPKAKSALPRSSEGKPEHAAFVAVARSVARSIRLPDKPSPAAILPDQVVWATTPVRLDFAGGWSDTPPICAELGGTVVNAAITLNGQYPVQVVAKLTSEPRITLNSMDLGERQMIDKSEQLRDYIDPSKWSALPKAAMILAGICPSDPAQNLKRWLESLGGGLDITFFAAVPKGSGLGTSSILGAAMIACLGRVVGQTLPRDEIIARTSLLEQMMTTGGGWQDQVGGIVPGVKLIRTTPGPDQVPSLHWTVFAPVLAERDRLLLYFTGQKRMARNILQRVVGRYLARDRAAIDIVHHLKRGAEQMKLDLDRGDFAGYARGVDEYWSLKQQLDPGSSNPDIERILRPINKHLLAKVLPGAGGGGFVFMVARDARSAEVVRQTLTRNPPNEHARFFDFEIDYKGLAVTVL